MFSDCSTRAQIYPCVSNMSLKKPSLLSFPLRKCRNAKQKKIAQITALVLQDGGAAVHVTLQTACNDNSHRSEVWGPQLQKRSSPITENCKHIKMSYVWSKPRVKPLSHWTLPWHFPACRNTLHLPLRWSFQTDWYSRHLSWGTSKKTNARYILKIGLLSDISDLGSQTEK